MQRAEIIVALALLAGAGLIMAEILRTLNIGWDGGPGDGFFPFWLTVGVLISSAIVFLQSLKKPSHSQPTAKPFILKEGLKSILKVFLPLAGAVMLMSVAGFYWTAALYLGFFMRWLGKHHWFLVIGISVLFPLGIYYVIEKKFFILLPKGYFDGIFPFK